MSTNPPDDPLAASVAVKVRGHILPLLMTAWFIAYIDRFNVSYAALQMNADLGLSAAAFGLGGGLFFLGYALFEVPSNVLLARVGARRWLGRIMITWGLVTIAMMWTRGPLSFYGLRLLLGAAEAGCFPGMAYCLSQWLAPRDRAAALASLGCVAMLSAVVGGPLAAGLMSLNGVMGLSGWRWLFMVEGLPAILIGMCVWKYLPDRPEEAPWLTAAERGWLAARERAATELHGGLHVLRTVVSNPRYWTWGGAFFLATAAGSATILFRPIIMRQMAGLGDAATAVLTAVPSILGAIVIVYVGRRATRHDERRWHAAIPLLLGAVGVALGGVAYGLPAALAVASLSTVAAAVQPPLFASVSAEATGATNAVGIAFVNSISALGGFLGPYAMGYLVDATGGLAVPCAAAGAIMVVGAVMIVAVPHRSAVAAPMPAAVAVEA